MNVGLLEKIGLTNSEAKVYLALLDLGSSTTGPIVEKSSVASSKIYEILNRLIQKGLVSYILKGNVKYFEAAPPNRILSYLKEKEAELKEQEENIKKILPDLEMKRKSAGYKSEAIIYRGMKGLETAFYDALKLLKKEDIFYVYGVPKRSKKVNYFFVRFAKDRAAKGVKMKIMFNEDARGDMQTIPKNNPLSETKFAPRDFVMPAAINIFKHRIIIFPSETEKQPILIVINNKEVADSFKSQFNILWNQITKVFIGLDGPRSILQDILETKKEARAMGLTEDKFDKNLPKELQKFKEEMSKRKIIERLLVKKGSKIVPSKRGKVKFLPKEFFSPVHLEIYGNKIAIIDWTKPITTILIEKKEIAEGYKRYFDLLWRMAKK